MNLLTRYYRWKFESRIHKDNEQTLCGKMQKLSIIIMKKDYELRRLKQQLIAIQDDIITIQNKGNIE